MATMILIGQRNSVRKNGKSLQAGGKPGTSTQETGGLESNTLGGGTPAVTPTDSSSHVNRIHGGNKNGNKSNNKNGNKNGNKASNKGGNRGGSRG